MRTKIIADACCNHMGNEFLMEEMVRIAAKCGADYIKFQLFDANTLNTNYPNYDEAYKRYKKQQIDEDRLKGIREACDKHGIELMLTVFHESLVSLAGKYADAFKIASPDFGNSYLVGLVSNAAKKQNKPVVVSTGMTDIFELMTCTQSYRYKDYKIYYLYCISKYPTDPKEIDYTTMKELDGFSDHTLGIDCAKKAIDMGVEWIEKHFTLCRDFEGKDHFISIDAPQLRELCEYRDYIHTCENYKKRWTNPLPPSCSDILCD